ncbi:hypothetical protein K2173_002978 [Erythroxylum novogranatense]|uniref:RING-type domain-containing protein n=1 Tax=Erythroxylum novogranatense TaxID=1862640 RepID=A0AAV8S820_9ROSI|nr:hypothetical protein K2173_002978 [Erythroxylum novogranatense]
MADSEESSGKSGSSSLLLQDNESKIKRKLVNHSMPNAVGSSSSLNEYHSYDSSKEKSQNLQTDLESVEVRPSLLKLTGEETDLDDWTDPIATEFEGLLFSNLRLIFQSAINKIVECGYAADVAEKAISRLGLYRGGKDLVSNIVHDALAILNEEKCVDISMDIVFENLQQMAEYTMIEMVNILREVKPSLSIGEVMWWLIMCDMNISQACTLEGSLMNEFKRDQVPGENYPNNTTHLMSEAQSSEASCENPKGPNIPNSSIEIAPRNMPEKLKFSTLRNFPVRKNPSALKGLASEKSLDPAWESGLPKSQASASAGKVKHGCKVHNKKENVPRIKSFESFQKYYSKQAFRAGHLGTIGGFHLDKGLKGSSELPDVHAKDDSLKDKAKTETPKTDRCYPVPVTVQSVLCATNDSLNSTRMGTVSAPSRADTLFLASEEKKFSSMPEAIADYLAVIPFDKSVEKYVPQDEKDELILKLVTQVQDLQDELQSCTDWANQKVAEACARLLKDMPELKALRKEKGEAEQIKKEKKILEENTMKRLSEIEFCLKNANAQVEKAFSTGCRLEEEQILLEKDMKTAKAQAVESAVSCQEALEREQKVLKNIQSWEGQKGLLQEELKTQKRKVAELQQEVDKEKNRQSQTEAKCKHERKEKETLLSQAVSIRKERLQLETVAKTDEDIIIRKTEDDLKKHMEDIKNLESEISELKLKSNASTRAALMRVFDGNYGTTDSKVVDLAMNDDQDSLQVTTFEGFGTGGLKRERECVMCLSEEKSVVFLPCAHQVLCTNCNELHEKQVMKECPSCRTLVQHRIHACFASQ